VHPLLRRSKRTSSRRRLLFNLLSFPRPH
jgi:hypothetical protein